MKHFYAPLWRIVLSYFALAYAGRHIVLIAVAGPSELGSWVTAGHALQIAAALFLWVALRWQARWIVPALVLTGAMAAVTALTGMATGSIAAPAAFMQLAIVAVVTGAFAFAMKLGLADDERRGPDDIP